MFPRIAAAQEQNLLRCCGRWKRVSTLIFVRMVGSTSRASLSQLPTPARIYRPGDPEDLAACIMSLVEQPRQAEAIARVAWEQFQYDS